MCKRNWILSFLLAACGSVWAAAGQLVITAPPAATPNPAAVGQVVSISASAIGHSTRSFFFDFGDGTSNLGPLSTPTSRTVTHTYSQPGTYKIKLIVEHGPNPSDIRFRVSDSSLQITVEADPKPIAIIMATPEDGQAPLAVNFNASQSADGGAAITSYFWEFGEGTTRTTTIPTTSFTYPTGGEFPAKLTITNSQSEISPPAVLAIHVGDRAVKDSDLHIAKLDAIINRKTTGQDVIKISGTLPSAGLPDDLTGAQLQLTLNDQTIATVGAALSRAAGTSSFKLQPNGNFTLDVKAVDLGILGIADRDGTQELRTKIGAALSGVTADTPATTAVVDSAVQSKKGVSSKATFNFVLRSTVTGAFKALKTAAKEVEGGYVVTTTGPLSPDFGRPLVPSGAVVITVGDAGGGSGGDVITIPLAALERKGDTDAKSVYTYKPALDTGAVAKGKLKAFQLTNTKKGFKLATLALTMTGIPASGAATTAFKMPLTIDVQTGAGVFTQSTTVEIKRKAGAKAWKR